MSNGTIPIDEARVYWNTDTGEVAVGDIDCAATRDHKRYPSWICTRKKGEQKTKAIACLFGELLWLYERDRINLKAALKEVRKIDGVCEWLDEGRVWI